MMNIQSGNMKKRTRKPSSSAGSPAHKAVLLGKLLLFLVVLGAILNGSVYLNDQVSRTEREIRNVRRELELADRELVYLRLRSAQLKSWPRIREKLQAFRLNLQYPEPGQVTRLTLMRTGEAPLEPSLMIGSR